MRERTVYEIGEVRVDLGRMAVTRAGSAIPLEPKAFDVLLYLVEHRDRLVTKDELLDAVWAGTFVTPNVLTRAVAQIRRGLGDESQDARYIETLSKRGYRLIAPVTVISLEGAAADARRPETPAARPDGAKGRRAFRPVPVVATLVLAVLLATAAALFVRPRGEGTFNPDAVHLTRLTNRRGFNGTPAMAPDGHAVVYSSDATGTLELYLASLLPGGAEVPLTRDGGQNVEPSWSPDGQWIAYHSRKRRGVWILPATGGVPQQISDFGSDPAWSPDGARLVFTSDAGGLAAQSSLWIVDRAGGGRRPLTEIGKPAGGHRAPVWSHDGRLVAFIVAHGGWEEWLWTVDVTSGALHQITTGMNAADPCFSFDDRFIYWGGTTEQGNGRLFRRAVNPDGSASSDHNEVVLPLDASVVDGLSLGSDGTLAFSMQTLDSNLWAIDVDTGGHASAPVRLTDDVARSTNPDYSTKGLIAYLQVPIGTAPTVWLVRDDGTGKTALLAGSESFFPQWAADGTRVLVVRPAGGSTELAWVDIASRRVTSAGPMKDMWSARLSPDGRQLAFHRIEPNGGMSVWVGGFDGSSTRVATDREAVSYPTWSPDGRFLAVELKRGDSTELGVVDREGGPVEELTTGRGQNWPHSWAPDNDRIAFAGERDGVWNIYTVSRRTKAVVPLTAFTSSTGYVRYPAWSPGGTRVVFERALETGGVWTLKLPQR